MTILIQPFSIKQFSFIITNYIEIRSIFIPHRFFQFSQELCSQKSPKNLLKQKIDHLSNLKYLGVNFPNLSHSIKKWFHNCNLSCGLNNNHTNSLQTSQTGIFQQGKHVLALLWQKDFHEIIQIIHFDSAKQEECYTSLSANSPQILHSDPTCQIHLQVDL